MKVTTPAQITQIATLADGSIKIVAVTPELAPDEIGVLFSLRRESGYWGFSSSQLQGEDLPDNTVQVNGKSASQRLRANLYHYWEQQGVQGDFEPFYQQQMERFITFVREKMQ
jgi:hypothetical protein